MKCSAPGPLGYFYLYFLFFIFLCPISFSPKKKDQKEPRRSNAAGLLFRETPNG